jgi:hypothetical protein
MWAAIPITVFWTLSTSTCTGTVGLSRDPTIRAGTPARVAGRDTGVSFIRISLGT